MRCLKRVVGAVVAAFVAGILLMYSGVISVAATDPPAPLTAFVLGTTVDNSVRYHAKGIEPPPLDDSQMVMEGFRRYRDMCAGCHLAPGMESSEIREGLSPQPPKLQETAADRRPAELFWIIQNGVKMSGMPAWGRTHGDAEIWAIVAFLRQLPGMTAEQYQAMGQAAGAGEEETGQGRRAPPLDAPSAVAEVTGVERAFAKTMADRDLDAFMSLVSADAVFFSGPKPLHGKAEVREWWARYFQGPDAPFAWEPDAVEALASGDLALSTGPVRDASGKPVSRFVSIWRREGPGAWRIVFDRGGPLEPAP